MNSQLDVNQHHLSITLVTILVPSPLKIQTISNFQFWWHEEFHRIAKNACVMEIVEKLSNFHVIILHGSIGVPEIGKLKMWNNFMELYSIVQFHNFDDTNDSMKFHGITNVKGIRKRTLCRLVMEFHRIPRNFSNFKFLIVDGTSSSMEFYRTTCVTEMRKLKITWNYWCLWNWQTPNYIESCGISENFSFPTSMAIEFNFCSKHSLPKVDAHPMSFLFVCFTCWCFNISVWLVPQEVPISVIVYKSIILIFPQIFQHLILILKNPCTSFPNTIEPCISIRTTFVGPWNSMKLEQH